jgi:hypothetical protein
MSLLLAAALAAAPATIPHCSWDQPGHNPYMGDVVAAVDRYVDIPVPVRARLKARMVRREYDEIVSIRRGSIGGRHAYGSAIRDMHFGSGSVCATVSRERWSVSAQERGIVYCEGEQCILVPTVCRNVSRIFRGSEPARDGAASATGGAAAPPVEEPEAAAAASGLDASGPIASNDAWAEMPAAGGGSFAQLSGPYAVPPRQAFALPTLGSGVGRSHPSAAPWPLPDGPSAIGPRPALPDFPRPGLPASLPTASPVPEPGVWTLMIAGLAALAWCRRHDRSRGPGVQRDETEGSSPA